MLPFQSFIYFIKILLFQLIFIHINLVTLITIQLVQNLPVMHETLVQFLGWEDLLQKE